jgi:hypothetical protein
MTALVWLAGPMSGSYHPKRSETNRMLVLDGWSYILWLTGLLMQPLIGTLSDRNTSRFGRRRPYIAFGSILVCCSLLGVAFARDIATIAMDILGTKSNDPLYYAVRSWLYDNSSFDVDEKLTGSPPSENHCNCFLMAFGLCSERRASILQSSYSRCPPYMATRRC